MARKETPKHYIVRRSSIHQRGVFARHDIPKDTAVIEYVGERIPKAESERRGVELAEKAMESGGGAVYIFQVNKKWDLDGNVPWNPARLINHSCDPNCEAIQDEDRIWIHAKRDIKKDEELSYDYGFDLDTWDEHVCRCGSEKCVGFIVGKSYRAELKNRIKEKAKKEKKSAKKEKEAAEAKEKKKRKKDKEKVKGKDKEKSKDKKRKKDKEKK